MQAAEFESVTICHGAVSHDAQIIIYAFIIFKIISDYSYMRKLFLWKRGLMIFNDETSSLMSSHCAHLCVAYAYMLRYKFYYKTVQNKKQSKWQTQEPTRARYKKENYHGLNAIMF